jgi:predicted alpha/beta hydrolase
MPAVAPERVSITAADGWQLGMRVFRARGSGRGAILCGHAMMTDGAYFDRPRERGWASWMAECGFDVYVADFRGHTLSGPVPRKGGSWTFDDLARLDWPAFRTVAAESSRCAQAELSVLGHSLGGLVIAADAALSGFQARRTVFLSCNVYNIPALGLSRDGLRARAVTTLLHGLTVGGRPFPARRLRIGNCDEAAPYMRQVLGWWRSGRFEGLDGVDYRQGLRQWRNPAVAIAGDGDWMCTPSASADFVKGGRSIDCVIEGRASGLSFAPNHFQLMTHPDAGAFHERLARFLETGTYTAA